MLFLRSNQGRPPMTSTSKALLTALFILSLAIELSYTLGVYTRQYVMPVVIYCGVAMYHYGMQAWDILTAQEVSINITGCNNPLT